MGNSFCKAPVVDSTPRVLWTGHLTAGHEQARKDWLKPAEESECEVRASLPPFNNANKIPIPEYVREVNAPAFGPNIANAVMRCFQLQEIKDIARELEVELPTYTLSKFVQDKMAKVHDMVKFAREDSVLGNRMKGPIDQLERFVAAFEKLTLDDIKNLDDWKEFMHKHVAKGWESKLHFDHILSNFGFDKASSDILRMQKFRKSDGEEVTFEQHAFRWLSKAFSAYGPEGALTDVVNTVFAMTGQDYKVLSDVDIARKIDDFSRKLERKEWSGLWIPSHLFIDAEGDDCLVWVLLTYIRKHAYPGSKLKVLVQLPEDVQLMELQARLEKLTAVDCEVWRDPLSRNLQAVKAFWLRTSP